MGARAAVLFVSFLVATAALAQAATPTRADFARTICTSTIAQADTSGIDRNFFVRLLWKESMFDPNALSPKGAQGLAQFMPGTAARRGLKDPYDPQAAVEASAKYLAELKQTFGNLGLAAAAYNAGEERVRSWLAGKGGMPEETQDYVAFITGKEIALWKGPEATHAIPPVGAGKDVTGECVALAMRLTSPSGAGVRLSRKRPWGVLVAAHFNQNTALAMYRRLRARVPAVLTNVDPMVIRKRNLSRGTKAMAMVYVGADSRSGADGICARLQSAGVPCLVAKTR